MHAYGCACICSAKGEGEWDSDTEFICVCEVISVRFKLTDDSPFHTSQSSLKKAEHLAETSVNLNRT